MSDPIEQAALADPRLTGHECDPATAVSGPLEPTEERAELHPPAGQGGRLPSHSRIRGGAVRHRRTS